MKLDSKEKRWWGGWFPHFRFGETWCRKDWGAAQDMVGLRMLDHQTTLCCCYGRAALGTWKRKHPCLVEAEGRHLQGVLGVSSMEGCVSPPSKTNWSKVRDCLGWSQEWRLGCFCQPKGSWKAAWLLLVSKPQGRLWTPGRIFKLSWQRNK